jgi:hypothetical protein
MEPRLLRQVDVDRSAASDPVDGVVVREHGSDHAGPRIAGALTLVDAGMTLAGGTPFCS